MSPRIDSPPPVRQPASSARQRGTATLLIALTVMVAVVGFLPMLPAAWHGITNISAIGDHGARAGKVTVTRCVRGPLLLNWQCSGPWSVNDVEAQHLPPVANMSILNDARRHPVGSRVDALSSPGNPTHGYLWGRSIQGLTVLYWVGAAMCAIALILSVAGWRRRRRVFAWTAGASLLLSGLILMLVRTAM